MIKLLVQEDSFWRQRAKSFWLRDGDLNTRFFHASATSRAKVNRIDKIQGDDAIIVENPIQIQEIAKSYFDNLFMPRVGIYEPVLCAIGPCVTQEDNELLVKPFSHVEFSTTLSQMHSDKSPGPDGFNLGFFKQAWDLCGKDIFEVCCFWLERGYFPTSVNDTNIALIPKRDNPETMKDWRPISLCNVVYKILSKVLANRLKLVLHKCVSLVQSAFCPWEVHF